MIIRLPHAANYMLHKIEGIAAEIVSFRLWETPFLVKLLSCEAPSDP
jgi:hypothetical protein